MQEIRGLKLIGFDRLREMRNEEGESLRENRGRSEIMLHKIVVLDNPYKNLDLTDRLEFQ
jgi:alpha-D-ribose 1-methylphosphonate 5-triphosphate synthase subunit PhnL